MEDPSCEGLRIIIPPVIGSINGHSPIKENGLRVFGINSELIDETLPIRRRPGDLLRRAVKHAIDKVISMANRPVRRFDMTPRRRRFHGHDSPVSGVAQGMVESTCSISPSQQCQSRIQIVAA